MSAKIQIRNVRAPAWAPTALAPPHATPPHAMTPLSPYRALLLPLPPPLSRQVKGKCAPREVAPVLVCNHVSMVDPLALAILHLPSIVSTKEVMHWPLVGVMMRALQVGEWVGEGMGGRATLRGKAGTLTGRQVSREDEDSRQRHTQTGVLSHQQEGRRTRGR